jgi:AraC-like DNA-binding protein
MNMQFFVPISGFCICLLLLVNIKKQTNKANIFLVFYLILINIFNLIVYASMYSTNKYVVAVGAIHFSPLFILSGPMLFFYVRSLLNDNPKLKRIDLLHFIPAVLHLINNFNYYLIPFDVKVGFAEKIISDRSLMLNFEPVLFSGTTVHLLRSIIALVYVFICAVMVYKHYKKNGLIGVVQYKLIIRWLVVLLIFSISMHISVLYNMAKLLFYWNFNAPINMTPWVVFFISIFSLIILNLAIFFFPNILFGLPQFDYIFKAETIYNSKIVSNFNTNTLTSSENLLVLRRKIENYEASFPYLSGDFNLQMMSKSLGMPTYHISYYLSEDLNTDFDSWITKARIKYVMMLVDNKSDQELDIDSLCNRFQFLSTPAFVKAFKQFTDKYPAEYVESCKS